MIAFLKKRSKALSLLLLLCIVFQVISVPVAFALTGGPSQPEVQAFQPAGTSDMVDLFTGDFSYNIPLFELPGPNGGYPFNLAYQAGIGMDQEASWVGLGWSLQPGAITRQMRGLPDEFNGDEVMTKMSIAPSVTVGLGAGASVELFGGAAELGLGFTVSQNNYKGFGYSIDGSAGFSKAIGGMTSNLGLGLSLDSKEGVGINPSLGLGGKLGQYGLGAGYNSKEGFTNVSWTYSEAQKSKDWKTQKMVRVTGFSQTTSLSMAHPGYTPQISMPMKNVNLALTLKAGASWWGIFGAPFVTGFYNEQHLVNDKKDIATKAYGYLNYQSAGGSDLLDFNREKDGLVSKESPNLGLPSMTYDIYSVTGQGIGMMYRPMRNDYGIVYDQEMSSTSNAVGAGVDVGPAMSHIGVNLNVNHSKSTSGKWTDNNDMTAPSGFQNKVKGSLYEPWYFKVHGEPAAEQADVLQKIGGEKAVRVTLQGDNVSPTAAARLKNNDGFDMDTPSNGSTNRQRKQRSNSIFSVTNRELLSASGEELIPYYKISYLRNNGNDEYETVKLDRKAASVPGHHFAGYSALTTEGLRYVYGIPAYNNSQKEFLFSTLDGATNGRVDAQGDANGDPVLPGNTDKFLKKTKIPKYAHAYLLTSILGPDYVDVKNDGVTEDDLGYWVKFTHKQTHTESHPYKWRDPYAQAHYQKGWKTDGRDNRGSFTYGEKEMWYLAQAETKSHIAVFNMLERDDARGVLNEFQQPATGKGEESYKLKNIELFTRQALLKNPAASEIIKRTVFEYSYSLCQSIENSVNNGGKLTLKRVWFEYGRNTRGRLNPYLFTYNNEAGAANAGGIISYDINAYDRWGNYKPYPGNDRLFNQDFPYVAQSPGQKNTLDIQAGAWSLREIQLPSGGKIRVDYETDDYAYVQNKQAMQMTELIDPNSAEPTTGGTSFLLNDNNSKIRFKLKRSVPGTLSPEEQVNEVLNYIDKQNTQLFFKASINLRQGGAGFFEYINGYVEVDLEGDLTQKMKLEKDASDPDGDYKYGSFYLVREFANDAYRNPMSLRAWQHIRTNQPDLANSGATLKLAETEGEKINQIKGLGGVGAQISQMFNGFYKYCSNKQWGRQVETGKCWIRLNSPDKQKYGGGLRVKQITMTDEWSEEGEGTYGQVYDYTTTEDNATISSGVASYEPIIGGEENALRYAKKYVQSIPMRSDNNLFFEYPVNESYFPAPVVGYSKVTVMNLPAAVLNGKTILHNESTNPVIPSGSNVSFGTSGKTVHEFFTAKDFPVITDETDKQNKQYKLAVPIPFLGSIAITKLSASQGYSIVTNNMHGKVKKVSNYRQSRATGAFETDPMSYVKYNYQAKEHFQNKLYGSVLNNTLKDNADGTLSVASASDLANPAIEKYSLGQQIDFFHDMRQYEDIAWGGGARYNTDIVYVPAIFALIPIPIPTIWPSVSKSTAQLRTSVTNKIIFRAGILTDIEAYDGESTVRTENFKWDKLTGAVVVTRVTNNFNAPVFSYSKPAYTEYQGMGAAYLNIGLTFSLTSVQKYPSRNDVYQFYSAMTNGTMHPGDEILLYDRESNFTKPLTRVIYMGNTEGDDLLYTTMALDASEYDAMIIRSGFRNQLTVNASTITALRDPSRKGTTKSYQKSVTVPK